MQALTSEPVKDMSQISKGKVEGGVKYHFPRGRESYRIVGPSNLNRSGFFSFFV